MFLIVDCFTFSLKHSVWVVDENGYTINTAELPINELASYVASQGEQLKSIKLKGPTEFCLRVKDDLLNNLNDLTYNKNLEIEVID